MLEKKISQIKMKTFGKLQPLWRLPIKKYLLFNIIDPTPFIFRRPLPKIKAKTDSKGETYLEIRIYADTNISEFKRIGWWKKYQKILPDFLNLENWDYDTLLQRFFHYILRKRLKLNHKQIDEWLVKKGFTTLIDDCYGSQQVNRFEKLLKRSSK